MPAKSGPSRQGAAGTHSRVKALPRRKGTPEPEEEHGLLVSRRGSTTPEPVEAAAARMAQAPKQARSEVPRPTQAPPPMGIPQPSKSMPPTSGAKPQSLSSMEIPLGPDGEPLIDHRGRSKPMYQRKRSRRPEKRWRPPWALNLLLGGFPGARMLANGEVTSGIAYAAVGLFAILPAILVLGGWSSRASTLQLLSIDEAWLLLHGCVALCSVMCFEGLRLASAFDPRSRADRLPRVFAAFAVPSLIVLFGGPRLLRHAPRIIEAAWFGALVLGSGALIAAAWCSFRDLGESSRRQRLIAIVGGVIIVIGLVVLVASGTISWQTLRMLAGSASEAGFQVLPELLGG